MSKRKAPYSHADGSNCWTKDCSLGNTKLSAKQAYQHALESFDEQAIRRAKHEYYQTEEGLQELRDTGKEALALRYEEYARKRQKDGKKAARPLRVALDLDNTTGDFTGGLRQYVAKQRNIDPDSLPVPSTYDYVEAGWFETKEDFYSTFREAEEKGLYKKLAPHEGAPKVIRQLVNSGNVEIHIVTARDPEWNEHTREWLKKHRIPFHSITHTEDKETVKNMDVFVDDSDKQIETLSAHGRKVIAYDNPYNRHLEAKYRVRTWGELEAVITTMKSS